MSASNIILIAAVVVMVLLLLWGVPCGADASTPATTKTVSSQNGSLTATVISSSPVAGSPLDPPPPKAGDTSGVKTTYVFSAGTPDKKVEHYTVNYSDIAGPMIAPDGRCVSVTNTGSNVKLVTCSDSPVSEYVQSWRIQPSPNIGYWIKSKGHANEEVCLQVSPDSQQVIALPCLDAKSQRFDVVDQSPREKQVRTADGMCISVEDSIFSNGVVVRPCAKNDKSQVWKF